MLVLTQREGETLEVGDDVRIYFKRIRGGTVRLCIEAPKDVKLVRVPREREPEENGIPEVTSVRRRTRG